MYRGRVHQRDVGASQEGAMRTGEILVRYWPDTGLYRGDLNIYIYIYIKLRLRVEWIGRGRSACNGTACCGWHSRNGEILVRYCLRIGNYKLTMY